LSPVLAAGEVSTASPATRAGVKKRYSRGSGRPLLLARRGAEGAGRVSRHRRRRLCGAAEKFARGDAEPRRRERLCTPTGIAFGDPEDRLRREDAKKEEGFTQRRRDAEVPHLRARHCVAPTRFVIPASAEPMDEPAATKEKV